MSFVTAIQKRLLENMGMSKQPDVSGDVNGIRVNGQCLCSCGKPYDKHPFDMTLLYSGSPIFKLDCSGQRLKL